VTASDEVGSDSQVELGGNGGSRRCYRCSCDSSKQHCAGSCYNHITQRAETNRVIVN